MDLRKTLIIGNAGSGKSWLAERLAARLGVASIDLDFFHWLPGGYDVARDRDEAIRLTRAAARGEHWVMEGIYGWLVDAVQSDATALVWLCVDEAECVANIRQRGVRRGGTADSFELLLRWAGTYRSRRGSSSYDGHRTIFERFAGDRIMLHSRDAVTAFADRCAA